jgi:CheY-like chemotaxis protein
VRGHKGAIKIYSEVGKGTTFRILFPAVKDTTESSATGRQATQEGWKGCGLVLLVDDEETIRTLGKQMLERIGFEVVTAGDGREALEVFEKQKDLIDLVLLDVTMPHMDGEETFRELRRIDPDVRVIMSSGYTEHEITARFAGKGLAGFVQKPYTLATLREHLRGSTPGGTQPL